jgi:Transcriptional Coactivator p15 (PC4)
MTDEAMIAEWMINNRRERLRVSIEQFKGVYLINVRKWFEVEDGLLRPGKAGIALNVKHLPQLAEAMIKALAVASERDLISGQGPPSAGSEGQP